MMSRIVNAAGTVGVPGAKIPAFGTLSVGVTDAWSNAYAMSCSHVLASATNGNAIGVVVESPAQSGQTPGTQVIGRVYRWMTLGAGDNFVDAALARGDSGIQFSNGALGLASMQTAIHGQVDDYGRYFGFTARIHAARGTFHGRIGHVYNHKIFSADGTDYSFSSILAYDALGGSFLPGDSGAAVVEETTGEFLGIHFAAEDNGQTGYCILSCLIWRDFAAFGLQLLP